MGRKESNQNQTLADEIAEPRPDMNIKVTAFTVSEKSINTQPLNNGKFTAYEYYHCLTRLYEFYLSIKDLERGTCIKGLLWPPLEPKTENCFSQISFDWFIRKIIEV